MNTIQPKISLDKKISPNPPTFIFRSYCKGRHKPCLIINGGHKILLKRHNEKCESFLWVKFLAIRYIAILSCHC